MRRNIGERVQERERENGRENEREREREREREHNSSPLGDQMMTNWRGAMCIYPTIY